MGFAFHHVQSLQNGPDPWNFILKGQSLEIMRQMLSKRILSESVSFWAWLKCTSGVPLLVIIIPQILPK
jgi:hypothetical protein